MPKCHFSPFSSISRLALTTMTMFLDRLVQFRSSSNLDLNFCLFQKKLFRSDHAFENEDGHTLRVSSTIYGLLSEFRPFQTFSQKFEAISTQPPTKNKKIVTSFISIEYFYGLSFLNSEFHKMPFECFRVLRF